MKKEIRPQFLKFFVPIIESLKDLGGSGTASEVIDLAISNMNISEKEQEKTNKKIPLIGMGIYRLSCCIGFWCCLFCTG